MSLPFAVRVLAASRNPAAAKATIAAILDVKRCTN
jgi:hypothetical protein